MGLAEQQKALAHLYTNAELRERFLADAVSVGKEIGLSENEARKIAEVSVDEFNFFSESLVWKRLNEVKKLLPLVNKAMEKDFEKKYFEFSSTFNPASVRKHLEDAIAFCGYIERASEKAWLCDLVRFEKARLEFNGLNRKCLLKHFNFDLREVIEKLRRDEKIGVVERKRWIGVWLRLGKDKEVRFYRFSLPSVFSRRHFHHEKKAKSAEIKKLI